MTQEKNLPPPPSFPPPSLGQGGIDNSSVGTFVNALRALDDAASDTINTPDGAPHGPGLRNMSLTELILALRYMDINVNAGVQPSLSNTQTDARDVERILALAARRRAVRVDFERRQSSSVPLDEPSVPDTAPAVMSSPEAAPNGTPDAAPAVESPPEAAPNGTLDSAPTVQSSPEAATNDTPDAAPTGYVCSNCNTFNSVQLVGQTWYCVFAGTDVGVFPSWHIAQPLVSGISHACYRKYSSKARAEAAFEEALRNSNVHKLPPPNAVPAVKGPAAGPSDNASAGPSSGPSGSG